MNDPFYGLTEHGDFAILGVNAYDDTSDDENSSMGQSVGDLSSLLAGITSSGLATTNTAVTQNNVPNLGSTSSSLNEAIFGRLDSSSMIDMMSANRGSAIGAEIVGKRSFDTQQQKQHTISGGIDETTISEIKDWLISIIPALNDQDAISYSMGLDAIGFNPCCVTMCELQFEDLVFMKVLHRRYLFNEVTGIEHPWEV